MKKKSRQQSRKQIDPPRTIALIVIIATVIAIFVIIDNPQVLNLGTIVGSSPYAAGYTIQPEYKTPVGGQITIKFAMATWNGRQWDMADLDRYQYDYDIWNDDINRIVARAPSFRLVHTWQNEITLQMNKEGTYNYSLRETVIFLQEGNRIMNGTVKKFKVIVGSGINPLPTPPPSVGTGGTVTVKYDTKEEVTVIETPVPAIIFEAYDPGVPTLTPGEIRVTPISTDVSVHTGTPVVTTIPLLKPVVTEDNDLTFIPAVTATEAPVKETAGFEGILVLISILILVRSRK